MVFEITVSKLSRSDYQIPETAKGSEDTLTSQPIPDQGLGCASQLPAERHNLLVAPRLPEKIYRKASIQWGDLHL